MHYPVSNSNLSAAHLAVFLEEKYALENVACRIIKAGINDTYSMSSASDKYVFRVYSLNWGTETEYVMQLRNIEKYDAAQYQPKIDSFLAGYESVTAITDAENACCRRWA